LVITDPVITDLVIADLDAAVAAVDAPEIPVARAR